MAASQGDTDAQYSLGDMYAEGKGLPQDDVQAYKWISIAAKRGNKKAIKMLDELASKMTSEQISEAEKLVQRHPRYYGRAGSPQPGGLPDWPR